MNRNSTFYILVVFTVLLHFNMMLATFAQEFPEFPEEQPIINSDILDDFNLPQELPDKQPIRTQAILNAKQYALQSVDQQLWRVTGCSIWGYFMAHTYHSPVPVVPLLGKSPEYVAYFTDTYRNETQRLQVKNARIGCIIGGIVMLIPYAVVASQFID